MCKSHRTKYREKIAKATAYAQAERPIEVRPVEPRPISSLESGSRISETSAAVLQSSRTSWQQWKPAHETSGNGKASPPAVAMSKWKRREPSI